MSKDKPLKDIWDYLEGRPTLGGVADGDRGIFRDKSRPKGICWACKRFAKGSLIEESPGTAKCCKGCDAYKGNP